MNSLLVGPEERMSINFSTLVNWWYQSIKLVYVMNALSSLNVLNLDVCFPITMITW